MTHRRFDDLGIYARYNVLHKWRYVVERSIDMIADDPESYGRFATAALRLEGFIVGDGYCRGHKQIADAIGRMANGAFKMTVRDLCIVCDRELLADGSCPHCPPVGVKS